MNAMRKNIGAYAYLRLPPGAVSDLALWYALLESGAVTETGDAVRFDSRQVDNLFDTGNESLASTSAWQKSQIHAIVHLEYHRYVLSARRIGKAGWLVEVWAPLTSLEEPLGMCAALRWAMENPADLEQRVLEAA